MDFEKNKIIYINTEEIDPNDSSDSDSINSSNSSNVFDNDHIHEIVENLLVIMEDYINHNPKIVSEEDFEFEFNERIKELFYIQFEDEIKNNPYFEGDLEDIIDEAFEIFYSTFMPRRSLNDTFIIKDNSGCPIIEKKIKYLKSKPQPSQRTKEWYEFRQNLITASNAHKCLDSQACKNQIIYEKCQPIPSDDDIEKNSGVGGSGGGSVNVNTTLHWGQKYEPISVMLYEKKFNLNVGDFGCIKHDKYSFLRASPDRIVIDKNSQRYGRMLEIKNIVNRDIDGIPKKEYWIQMQLQMEVCDLDECDFLETRFIEYSDEKSFIDDSDDKKNLCISEDHNMKGVMIYFETNENKPFYVYKPFNITDHDSINKWGEEEIEKYENEPYNYTYIKYIYWKLDEYSCVLVQRNNRWFSDNINEISDVWKIIENERINGYEHRAPNRKIARIGEKSANQDVKYCLINLNKGTGEVTIGSGLTQSMSNMIINKLD